MKCLNENVFLSAITHLLFCSTDDHISVPLIHNDRVLTRDPESVWFIFQDSLLLTGFGLHATLKCTDLVSEKRGSFLSAWCSLQVHTQEQTNLLIRAVQVMHFIIQ